VRSSVPEGDFAVLDAVSDQGQEVVLIGSLAHVQEGESLVAGGGWQRHARHGWQFAVQRVRIQEPVSEQAVAAYLESIKHVGPRGAATLVESFGAGAVLAAIDRDPYAICELDGIVSTTSALSRAPARSAARKRRRRSSRDNALGAATGRDSRRTFARPRPSWR